MRIILILCPPRYQEAETSVDDRIEERLSGLGVRYTQGRQLVVRALGRAGRPLSAAELHDVLSGRVPLSSLYRSLGVLEEAGVLATHHGTRGLTRYEPAEWLSGHHHHLVCVDCGVVEDVRLPPEGEAAIRGVVAGVVGGSGFSPVDHALEIEGRCRRCA